MSGTAALSAFRQAARRLPRSLTTTAQANQHVVNQVPRAMRATFASAAAAMDEDLERESLYGAGQASPMTEYLNLAVKGHTAVGPPPKYRPVDSTMLKCGLSEDVLRFETSSYGRLILPPYVQHQEHKVTLSVRWQVLPLNDFEKRILMEIVGSRYREDKGVLRLSSEQFGSRIENKRHLVSMLDRLVLAARKLAAEAKQQQEAEAVAED